MGIDIYAEWQEQTDSDRAAQAADSDDTAESAESEFAPWNDDSVFDQDEN